LAVPRLLLAPVVVIAALAAACGDSPSSPSGRGGSLRLMMTDSPFSDAKAVLVTFSEVSVHRSEGDSWTRLPFADGAGLRTCDLKKLESGAEDVLGVGDLAPGHYTQIRLTVSSARLYFDNAAAGTGCASAIAAPAGRDAQLEIPSGEVKLNREFEITSSEARTILLDFDGDRSIRETGNGRYMMSPVIGVVSVK
jgi:hypothetical protein